jgi:hypothetical protein
MPTSTRARALAFRVILDRSAFHGERFDLLNASPLRRLTSAGVVEVYLTPVFLNETLTAYGSRSPVRWQHHLAFALDVCNGGIFLDKNDIWREELVMGRGPFARRLLPERASKRYDSRPELVAVLRAAAETGDLDRLWIDSKIERDESYNKSVNQQEISEGIRKEAKARLGTKPTPTDLAGYPFKKFRRTELIRTGRHLMSVVTPRRPRTLAHQWALAPLRFPYYTAFVDGFLYNGYYAALEQRERIDRNAQADYEQLAYLTWADLVVSNDASFFTHAFDAIWRGRGKRLESAETFVKLLERLA